MLQVQWVTRADGQGWLPLLRVNLSSVKAVGVYVIWTGTNGPNVIRVGQGDISDRLSRHRQNPNILAYAQAGELMVTWAVVPEYFLDGVERYLADRYLPRVGDAFPDVLPVAINLPGT
jgi:hypothetical protein